MFDQSSVLNNTFMHCVCWCTEHLEVIPIFIFNTFTWLVHFSSSYFATSRATKCCVLLRNYVKNSHNLVIANCYTQRKDITVCELDFHWNASNHKTPSSSFISNRALTNHYLGRIQCSVAPIACHALTMYSCLH
jgi:hypothetical protein